MKQDSLRLFKVMAGAVVLVVAATSSFATDVVPSGPTVVEADTFIVPACHVDMQVSHETRVASFADSVPGGLDSTEARGFVLRIR